MKGSLRSKPVDPKKTLMAIYPLSLSQFLLILALLSLAGSSVWIQVQETLDKASMAQKNLLWYHFAKEVREVIKLGRWTFNTRLQDFPGLKYLGIYSKDGLIQVPVHPVFLAAQRDWPTTSIVAPTSIKHHWRSAFPFAVRWAWFMTRHVVKKVFGRALWGRNFWFRLY